MTAVPAVTARVVLRAEGMVWRWEVDGLLCTRPQAREALEERGLTAAEARQVLDASQVVAERQAHRLVAEGVA